MKTLDKLIKTLELPNIMDEHEYEDEDFNIQNDVLYYLKQYQIYLKTSELERRLLYDVIKKYIDITSEYNKKEIFLTDLLNNLNNNDNMNQPLKWDEIKQYKNTPVWIKYKNQKKQIIIEEFGEYGIIDNHYFFYPKIKYNIDWIIYADT